MVKDRPDGEGPPWWKTVMKDHHDCETTLMKDHPDERLTPQPFSLYFYMNKPQKKCHPSFKGTSPLQTSSNQEVDKIQIETQYEGF